MSETMGQVRVLVVQVTSHDPAAFPELTSGHAALGTQPETHEHLGGHP